MRSERLMRLWKDRNKIVEGIANIVFVNQEVEKIASERVAICKSNKCGHYDQTGSSPKAYIKGSPSCGICGCNIRALTHSLHSECSLTELGQAPLWEAVMTEEEENSIND
jgi:hypothetical protein